MYASKCIQFFLLVVAFKSIEAILTPEDEDFFGHTADRYDWSKHPCRRKCSKDEKPKTCHYLFVVEQFSSMSKACYDCPHNMTDCFRPHCIPADGVVKPIVVINRQLPGPMIEVCEDDEIVVKVRNAMLSESTVIHWHGFKQKGTPYMDGVPSVTQCPILPGETFTYTYNATNMGTFFWHSHIGFQKADGLFGALIVKRRDLITFAKNDYEEHLMIVNDWNHLTGDAAFIRMHHYKTDKGPDSILVNGHGRYQKFKTNDSRTLYTPLAVFEVEHGKNYQFRYINAGSEDCPISLSIDNHTLIVSSVDSNDIIDTEVDWINTWQGERADFVLRSNQKPGNYWIRLRGYAQCRDNSTSGVYQLAILRYKGAKIQEPKEPVGYKFPKATKHTRVFNPYDSGDNSEPTVNVTIPNLTALDANDKSLRKEYDQQIFLLFDFFNINNFNYHRKNLYGYDQVPSDMQMGTGQMNGLSLKLPEYPLLSQWQQLKADSFCNSTHLPKNKNCTIEQCACTHVLQVELDSVVEIVMIDRGGNFVMKHPYHFHGHFFRVVYEENLDGLVTMDRVKKLDKEGKIKRRLDRAPMKDTMKTPSGGFTIIRLLANNPGFWLFHCHYEQHNNIGMALVIKVGEYKDFPKKPKGFPRCGNYNSESNC